MVSKQALRARKQLDHLLTFGTLMLRSTGLINFTRELRDKYKINLALKQTELDAYKEELESKGTIKAIREEARTYFVKLQAEDEGWIGSISKDVREARNEKAKDFWNRLWPMISERIRQDIEAEQGELTVDEALTKYNLRSIVGDLFVDEFVEYVITDELQAFAKQHTGEFINVPPDLVAAVAGPLAIQEKILTEFKKVMRQKFPAVTRTFGDRISAACLAYHKMGLSDKKIALKLYDLDPSRKDSDCELSRQEAVVRKKRERIKNKVNADM